MSLHVSVIAPDLISTLREEARAALPRECCGLLAGRGDRVLHVCPVANIAPDPVSSFEIDPIEMWRVRRELSSHDLDVVGFYHSHPRTEPVPSTYDVVRAYYPESVYVIVGGEPDWEVRAFSIVSGTVREIAVVGDDE